MESCFTHYKVFFNEKLHQVVKGVGTHHKTLARIMVSCSEIDINGIKACYQKFSGISLCQTTLDEAKGECRKILWLFVEDGKHSLDDLKVFEQKIF